MASASALTVEEAKGLYLIAGLELTLLHFLACYKAR